MLKKIVILLSFVFLASVVDSASLSLAEQKKYKQLIEGQGLYSENDDVQIFTANNFKSLLYGKNHGWLVEFYNSWCGFCQRFSPSWKALATDVKVWSDYVNIGAVDCSDEDNSPICRDFEIMGYPTLRYFHENYTESPKKFGVNVQKGEDLDRLRHELVKQMLSEQSEGRGHSWPNILPSNAKMPNDLFTNAKQEVQFVILIVRGQNSFTIPEEVILDMGKIPQILVTSIPPNNTQLITNLNLQHIPALLVIHRNLFVQELTPIAFTREAIEKSIKEFLKPKGIEVRDHVANNTFKGRWLDIQVPDISALLEAREQQELKRKVKKMGNVVFQMDLETALRYSLKHEIATTKQISGEKLSALKSYLDVIIKYFPLGRKGRNFMEDLRTEIESRGPSVQGADINTYLQPIDEESEEIFSTPQKWLACAGSASKFRGYPCGMWKMFHYLTVNAAEQNSDKLNSNPREVLEAMLGYIKNFFGCEDCSKHFQEMAAKNEIHSVPELSSSIVWLWLAHNQVNKRLAGDATEDPEHPKIQFPAPQDCPKCRDGDRWNLEEVLQYLKHMYSNVNVRYLGANTRILHDGLTSTSRAKRSATSWVVINQMDVSMCFVLYVFCFGLLVFIIRLFLKNNYKKKMYVYDILGKV